MRFASSQLHDWVADHTFFMGDMNYRIDPYTHGETIWFSTLAAHTSTSTLVCTHRPVRADYGMDRKWDTA